jgi:probable HAF family extracellular repeat protein
MRLRIALVSSFGMVILLGVSAQAQNPTARYVIRDLGALPGGGFSQPGLVNDAGVVAGLSTASDGIQHAVLWVGDQIVDLNSSGDHGLNAGAFGINALGRVSLQTETSACDPNDENFGAYETHRVCAAAVWQGGRIIVLPTLGGNNSTVGNVNSRGQIPGLLKPLSQILRALPGCRRRSFAIKQSYGSPADIGFGLCRCLERTR